jgi:hypothetical protein
MSRRAAFILLGLVAAVPANAWVTFTDVTESAKVTFRHVTHATGEHLFPETVGSGCAFLDYDRDGYLDIYLVNNGDFDGDGAPNTLYRNNGDETFTDVTESAGVGDMRFGIGVAVGDYDADGWDDIYVCNFARNTLYRNNGDGTFTDVTESAGVGETRWSASAVFFDMDNDLDLDLYVANYVDYKRERDGCRYQNLTVYCSPETFDPVPDTLYRNNGDGTFTDVSETAGITVPARGLGVVAADYDDDGDRDIIVANDMNPNFLYRNRGDGTFEEVGLDVGVALAEDATMGNGMGVDVADYDNDGRLDVLVTNFQDQVNTLFRNDGDGFFTDVSYPTGTGAPSLRHLAWGCGFVDLDNDGWRDLFIGNGHVHDNIAEFDQIGTYRQAKLIFKNARNGAFENVSGSSGDAVQVPQPSRGVAFGDYDNDGDLDVLANNVNAPATLYRNDGGNANGWIRVVFDDRSRVDGVRVWVESPDGSRQMAEVHGGGSYGSSHDSRLLFGIGVSATATVRVEWGLGTLSAPVVVRAGDTLRLASQPRE